ncbi:MAG TPA: flippase-like domain-containing protein [Phycisphaerales bacterium]|nr:flippase-like domain-containing protein [Phycisphaerales bacterium]
MAQSTKRRGHIGTILRIGVACGAVALLGVFWDWPAVFDALSRMKLANLLLAVVLFASGGVFMGLRWYALLRAQQVDVRPITCIRITYLGMFYNNVLMGSVGGDFLRMWYIAQHTHRRLEAVTSVLVDRALGLGILVAVAAVAWRYIPPGEWHLRLSFGPALGRILREDWPWALATLALLAAGLAGVLAWPRSRRVVSRAWHAVASRAARFGLSLKRYAHHPLSLVLGVALTLVSQSVSIIGFYLLGRSMEIPLGLAHYFVFFPVGWVIGALPISIGGTGVVEGGLYWLFTDIGRAEKGAAAALAICQRFVLLLGSMPGLAVHLLGGHLPKLPERGEFFVDAGQTEG